MNNQMFKFFIVICLLVLIINSCSDADETEAQALALKRNAIIVTSDKATQ